MIDALAFKQWLKSNTDYSEAVIGDIVSRAKRADRIREWSDEDVYLFRLNNNPCFSSLSMSVKSQIRRSVNLYSQFVTSKDK